jgi:hypothetical protein
MGDYFAVVAQRRAYMPQYDINQNWHTADLIVPREFSFRIVAYSQYDVLSEMSQTNLICKFRLTHNLQISEIPV